MLNRNTVMNSDEKKDVLRNLFFHPLLDRPCNRSDFVQTNKRMNSELRGMWKDV